MRRATILAPVGCFVFLATCARPIDPTSPEYRVSAAVEHGAGASEADAAGSTSNTLALHFIRSNECAGEDVEITGYIHLLSHTQRDGSVIGHFNYQHVTGVGLTSGTPYRVSAVDQLRLAAPFPSQIQSVRSFHLTGPGPGNDLLVTALYHITVSANGDVSVAIDDLTARCPDGAGGA